MAAEQRKLTAPIRRIKNTEALAKLDELASLETELADTELYEAHRKADLIVLLNKQASLQQQHNDKGELISSDDKLRRDGSQV